MINENEAPEGMIAVQPWETEICCGCYYWEHSLTSYQAACNTCCPTEREDRQYVIFVKKDQK